jgi:hypothetical protein
MTFHPDMSPESQAIRAIGWLHPDHPYSKGEVAPEFLARLKEFVARRVYGADEVYSGPHTCEFCRKATGMQNLAVPSRDLLFVAPEMVVHYIEEHRYQPPAQFVEAVLRSPLPDTIDYRMLTEVLLDRHHKTIEEMKKRSTEETAAAGLANPMRGWLNRWRWWSYFSW